MLNIVIAGLVVLHAPLDGVLELPAVHHMAMGVCRGSDHH